MCNAILLLLVLRHARGLLHRRGWYFMCCDDINDDDDDDDYEKGERVFALAVEPNLVPLPQSVCSVLFLGKEDIKEGEVGGICFRYRLICF